MPKFKTKQEAHDSCVADGYLRTQSYINKERIKSLVVNADTNVETAALLITLLEKDDRRWMSVYTLHYEAMRTYAEAFLLLEKVISQNHQCIFAYLCVQHEEFDFDWTFFEKIRTKRNGVNYYGEHVSYDDWKAVEGNFKKYITLLKQEIEKKVRES